jgi:L-asparagine transporter-like permease
MPPPPAWLWSGRWWVAERSGSGSARWLAWPSRWGYWVCSSESSGAWSLSTLALSGSERAGAGASAILRHADLIVLAVALPVFIAADWPLTGYAVAAAAWVAQRLLFAYANARAARSLAAGDRRDAFRTTAISAMGRVWLVSVAVLLVGLIGDREDGLAAALLVAALFTIHLATLALTRQDPEASA